MKTRITVTDLSFSMSPECWLARNMRKDNRQVRRASAVISGLIVQRVTLNAPHDQAKRLIESVARKNGFEITNEIDLNNFVRRMTGMDVDRKAVLLQLHIPSLILGSTLLSDSLPVLLPLRIILREVSDSLSELDYPQWSVTRTSSGANAEYCMDILYTDTVGRLTAAIRKSLTEADKPPTEIRLAK